jgi:hypothetical protein
VDALDGGPWTTGAQTATSIASMTKVSIMVSAPSETPTPQSSPHFAAEFCPSEFLEPYERAGVSRTTQKVGSSFCSRASVFAQTQWLALTTSSRSRNLALGR